VASFKDINGAPYLPTVDAAGNVPVSIEAEDEDPSMAIPGLLRRLVWEMSEFRRVYCEATDQAFLVYDPDADLEQGS
jgi:hypothetical protein